MKKRFAFAALLIAMVVLTQIPVSLVRAEDTGLLPISGSDCDSTTFEYSGHTVAEGFAASISADLPIPAGTGKAIRFGCAVAGLGESWEEESPYLHYRYTPFVNEMRVKVKGDDLVSIFIGSICDNTGTDEPSMEFFPAVLNLIDLAFNAWAIYDWLAEIYQEPPDAEFQPEFPLHWVQAIARQKTETAIYDPYVNPDNPRLQTATSNILSYFYEDSSRILNVTAEAEIYVQCWDIRNDWNYHFYVGTYSVSFEVSVNTPPNTPSQPSGLTTGYRNVWYTYSTNTTDPDGDDVRYQFYWGDGSYTTGWYTSGANASASHSWSSFGYKYVKVRAQDSTGAWSDWSSCLTLNIKAKLSILANEGGTTIDPTPGIHAYDYGTILNVTAIPDEGFIFAVWNLDGQCLAQNPITVTMNSDHTLKAYFNNATGGGGGSEPCPTLFVWNGSAWIDYGVIDIHNPTGEDVIREVSVQTEDAGINNCKATFRLREGWEGLNFSESVIDQVKLYAINEDGKLIQNSRILIQKGYMSLMLFPCIGGCLR
jgi:hypothetical protein